MKGSARSAGLKGHTDEDNPAGIAGLRKIKRAVKIPVVAIGGINAGNAGGVLDAGADAIAVIRAVCSERDKFAATKRLKEALALL